MNLNLDLKYIWIFHLYPYSYKQTYILFSSHWKEAGFLVEKTAAGDIQDEMDYIAISESRFYQRCQVLCQNHSEVILKRMTLEQKLKSLSISIKINRLKYTEYV